MYPYYSKQIFGLGGSDSSTRHHKLSRSVRVFASNYLQENLLSLPSIPTEAKLREIRERVEKDAQERKKELERERELKRKQAEERTIKVVEERSGLDKFMDFSKDFSTKVVVSFKKESDELDMPIGRKGSNSGWMCSSNVAQSVDSTEDPFDLQKQQLLVYIKQAREANRMDEVYALEASLREIEATILEQRKFSYGLSPDM